MGKRSELQGLQWCKCSADNLAQQSSLCNGKAASLPASLIYNFKNAFVPTAGFVTSYEDENLVRNEL